MWLKWSLWLNRISTIFSDHSSELKPIDGHEIAALEEKLGYEMSDFLLPFNDIAMDTNNEPEENDDINDLLFRLVRAILRRMNDNDQVQTRNGIDFNAMLTAIRNFIRAIRNANTKWTLIINTVEYFQRNLNWDSKRNF